MLLLFNNPWSPEPPFPEDKFGSRKRLSDKFDPKYPWLLVLGDNKLGPPDKILEPDCAMVVEDGPALDERSWPDKVSLTLVLLKSKSKSAFNASNSCCKL